MNLPPINTVKAFLTAADHGRFNIAAEKLALTESAVSHQIRKLEAFLGATLMERGRNGLVLTQAGKTFYPQAREAIKQLEAATLSVQQQAQQQIRITLPPSLASLWLSPALWSFYSQHTEVEVAILATKRVCELEKERFDIGIRLTDEPGWANCHWLPLWEEYCFPVATPETAALIRSQSLSELPDDIWLIENKLHPTEWQDWSRTFDITLPEPEQLKQLNSFDYVINAALSGQGIAMGRTPMVNTYLNQDRIQPVFGQALRLKTGKRYYAVWPDQPVRNRVREKFLDWLVNLPDTGHDPL